MCYCPTPTLHLNLALTGDGAFQLSPQKTYSVWFISILNYGDTENVLINHLLLVIPMSYPCHYTNLCPHKPHKHAHTHTHTHRERESERERERERERISTKVWLCIFLSLSWIGISHLCQIQPWLWLHYLQCVWHCQSLLLAPVLDWWSGQTVSDSWASRTSQNVPASQ